MKKNYINKEFLKKWGLKKHTHDVERMMQKKEKPVEQPKAYTSKIVDMLNRSTNIKPNNIKNKSIVLNITNNFSVIENPAESLKLILSYAKDFRNNRVKEVYYDHSRVNKIDLSAESILGYIAAEIKKERTGKKKLIENGRYPIKRDVIRLIKSVGVIRNLDIKHEFLDLEESKYLRVFRKGNSSYLRQVKYNTADLKERTIKDFVDHINGCLEDHGRKLKPQAVIKLVAYTGEILTNAEDHPGYNDWTIIGYLDNKSANHFCEITIFNFGKSIADTFKELAEDSFTYKQILPFIDAHKKKGFLNIGGWNEEDLLTLIALQGNISTKNKSASDDRGQGTVDLINFFHKMHSECTKNTTGSEAKMAILSGNTYILFDGTYSMKADSSGRQVIAFNSSNDLKEKPDKQYIRNLGDIKFPGTIIGIKFPMQIDIQTEKVSS